MYLDVWVFGGSGGGGGGEEKEKDCLPVAWEGGVGGGCLLVSGGCMSGGGGRGDCLTVRCYLAEGGGV